MESSKRTPRLFLLYMLGYLLLMEWLLPLPEVTKTAFVPVFMAGAAFFFLVMFLGFPWWGTLLLFCIGILFGLHTIFFNSTFLGSEWWTTLSTDISTNVGFMMNGQWDALSDLFRSLLFLLLLAIMSYLIYFWVIHARRILFFFAFTVIYIGIMDTFLPYDGSRAVIRIFIIGFVLMALLQWDRLAAFFPGAKRKSLWFRWAFLSAFLLLVAAGVGMAAPKADPQWPDPVPFLESKAGFDGEEGLGSNNIRKIGYGDNDERLGGGFEMDDSAVFTARGEESGYWRGESKNVYTGHGWDSDTPEESAGRSTFFQDTVQTEDRTVEVEMVENRAFDFAFYPGAFRSLDISGEENVQTEVDRYSGKASIQVNEEPYEAEAYWLNYEDPEFPIERMKDNSQEDPEDIKEHYLSLPDDLPASIQELAKELTEEEDNRYDKVRAIEDYFHGADFVYDTSNIAVPEEGEDYVEQFLFETQRGYCDNFSTSMAVMLRTLDIPTRWVKGFTEGEEIDHTGEETVYEVTNANAHSWVEVYFPGVGWVPFEPTRGFTAEFDYSREENSTDVEDENEEEEDQEEEEETEEDIKEQEEEEDVSSASSSIATWPFFAGGTFIVSLAFIFRFRLMKKILLYRFKRANNSPSFTKAFHSLLWLLRYAGFKKEESETLREYAWRMDQLFETKDMSYLAYEYEKIHYGKQSHAVNWSFSLSAWENMVNRIKA
ncbi:transglutaminaseTgpA domain-containing protein [Alteribacillus sp. JSM 102045]|uniref:transglutaminase family protein n=1 Tax=Alteribacillus sp. JSM 102045 TaxID=1562101 RepID=UPI0035C1320D